MSSITEITLSAEAQDYLDLITAAYERGYLDAIFEVKRVNADLVHTLSQERRTWGTGGRKHFADPRPGDFPGRAA